MRFIEAFPAADGDPLSPLVAAELSSSRLHAFHQERRVFGRVHALGVWEINDLKITGFPSHLYVGRQRFADPSVEPKYVGELIDRGVINPLEMIDLPDRVIDEPVVAFVGWGREVYGHVLIDIAPRIAIAEKALGRPRDQLHFLMPSDAPAWFRDVITLTGAKTFIEYDPRACNPVLRQAYVATLPSNTSLHPACRHIFDEMRPRVADGLRDMIYITRRNAEVSRKISMRNVAEIEAIAEGAGLRVVAPEQLPVIEQAKLFAGARLVVGEYGSALMSAVFSRPGAVIGAIGSRSKLLSAISALNDLRLGILTPDGDVNDPNGYDVDPESFSRWLNALIEASGGAK